MEYQPITNSLQLASPQGQAPFQQNTKSLVPEDSCREIDRRHREGKSRSQINRKTSIRKGLQCRLSKQEVRPRRRSSPKEQLLSSLLLGHCSPPSPCSHHLSPSLRAGSHRREYQQLKLKLKLSSPHHHFQSSNGYNHRQDNDLNHNYK